MPSITAPRDCFRAKRKTRWKRSLPRARWSSEQPLLRSEQRFAESMLQMGTVPRRQDERQCVGLDLHLKEKRTPAPVDSRAHVRNFGVSSDDSSGGKPARARDRSEIGSVCGVRFLHAGLAVALVVEHHDGEVARALRAYGGETPQAHQ